MNAFERRLRIVERMKVRKHDTVCNLSCEFEVSRRTVLTDILYLSTSGYPIQAEPGRNGGVRWYGDKQTFPFTERQMTALHNAIGLVSKEDKQVLENMLRQNERAVIKRDDIFQILSAADISQRRLAEWLGISESYLSKILSGEKTPSGSLAKRILELRETI